MQFNDINPLTKCTISHLRVEHAKQSCFLNNSAVTPVTYDVKCKSTVGGRHLNCASRSVLEDQHRFLEYLKKKNIVINDCIFVKKHRLEDTKIAHIMKHQKGNPN